LSCNQLNRSLRCMRNSDIIVCRCKVYNFKKLHLKVYNFRKKNGTRSFILIEKLHKKVYILSTKVVKQGFSILSTQELHKKKFTVFFIKKNYFIYFYLYFCSYLYMLKDYFAIVQFSISKL